MVISGRRKVGIRVTKDSFYALELTGIFVLGLGMMMLILVSLWAVALGLNGSETVVDEVVGESARLNIQDNDLSNIASLFGTEEGSVAGAVNDSDKEESELRSEISKWISEVRVAQGLTAGYRDNVLDRESQDKARELASRCDLDGFTSWEDKLNVRIDGGYTISFSEAAFFVNGGSFASDFVERTNAYRRLFEDYDAYGVGVAARGECQKPYTVVVQMSQLR